MIYSVYCTCVHLNCRCNTMDQSQHIQFLWIMARTLVGIWYEKLLQMWGIDKSAGSNWCPIVHNYLCIEIVGLHINRCTNLTATGMQMYLSPDLPKGVLYMHSFKTHFSLPSVSYINAPTGYVFTTSESWTVCFHSGLFSSLSGIHELTGSL